MRAVCRGDCWRCPPRATLPGWLGLSVSARLRIDGWSPRSGLSMQRREGPRAVLGVTQPFRPRPSESEYPGGLAQAYSVVPNTLNRKFAVAAPNRVGAGAITYVWTTEGWLDLAVVLDLSARRVMAWGMGSRLTQALAMAALTGRDPPTPGGGILRTVGPRPPPPDIGGVGRIRFDGEQESARELRGQCGCGKVLSYAENGTRVASALSDP